MNIVIASNNQHKIREIKEIIGDKFDKIYSLNELGIDVEVEENGSSFYENALIKAKAICEIARMPALADDSGLEVDALGGKPGIYSARYAGEHGKDGDNNALLLKNMQDAENRKANFTSAIVVYYPDGRIISAEGKVYGEILRSLTGDNGFGYDPLFYSYELKKSFGIASAEEKNAISHRGKALAALAKKL